jgi:FdhE protein
VTRSITGFFRRHEPLAPEVAAALEHLDQLVDITPTLREAAALQAAILRAMYAEPLEIGRVELTKEQAAGKLYAGVPLLRGASLPLSPPAIEAMLLRLCEAAREHVAAPGAADEIAAVVKGRSLQVEELARAVLDGQAQAIREQAAGLGVDGELLCALLRFSLFPALAQAAARLAALRAAATWEQGFCPICGSWPLLGEQRGLEQTRLLRCGLCAAEWPVDRLWCPFCGNRDHEQLGYLYAEGQEQQRAVTCENCRGYVKVLASLTSIPPLDLAVQDLATLHLDIVALERGYAAPT